MPDALRGYLMVLTAATLFAINGVVAKVIIASGLSAYRLCEVRTTWACIGFALVLALVHRSGFRLERHEAPFLLAFGFFGVFLVQIAYFLAIHRLDVGVALILQYTAPVLVALWARLVMKQHVRRRIWISLILTLGGLALVVDLRHGVTLDSLGVAYGLLASVAFAIYILIAEQGVQRRDVLSLTFWGFLFAAILWALLQPWWTFPTHNITDDISLLGRLEGLHAPAWALLLYLVVLGTMVPFWLIIGSLRHLPATRVGITATFEPVVATVVAYAWLGETLGPSQLVGGALVLGGILLAQTAR